MISKTIWHDPKQSMFDPNARSITPTAAFKTSIKTLKRSYSHSNGYKSVQPWEWVQKSDTQMTFGNLQHFQTFPLSERSFLAWTDWSFTYFVCNNSRAALIKRDLRAVLSLICFHIPPGSIEAALAVWINALALLGRYLGPITLPRFHICHGLI